MSPSSNVSRRTLTTAAGAAALAAAAGLAARPAHAADGDPAATGPAGEPATGPADEPATGPADEPAASEATEFRGMWLTTVSNRDWPSRPGLSPGAQQQELLALLDTAVDHRLNAVVLQVRATADALWPSPYEPWAAVLTGDQGRDPGWDPLDFAVREAHARDLELHAWFNPYRIATRPDPSLLAPDHPARQHPDWVVPYAGSLLYNPGLPEVRRFVQDAMLDAVARYDVDGVHFDDYFYPYPVAGHDFDDDDAYRRYGDGFTDRAAWRRDNVDRLVRETAGRIAELNRSQTTGSGRPRRPVRFGISPFGVWRDRSVDPLGSDTHGGLSSFDDLCADTRGWVLSGWLDYIAPQLYWSIGFATCDYAELAPWWAELVRGTDTLLFLGEALYKAGDPDQSAPWQDPAELSRHLTLTQDLPEVRGNLFFTAGDVAADRIGAMRQVVTDHYRTRVRPPR
ncbi:family 10 glycosylhydrolase [Kitasatospora sp. NBC_01250]|uniref:glycoside hydrolase family 10 protein n=1 Tax=Kitasatospora sp. NBC_01250 TaxID=2903571 RepID=UPI002E37FFCB|nr:family 10 glycosylhydrolase [Kitasatospora sp. NBC_01250]